jgi:hypothetical protein
MTKHARALTLIVSATLAVAACASTEVDDMSEPEGGDGADVSSNLSWLAQQARLMGPLEPINVQDVGGVLIYPTQEYSLEIGQDGFHKFTLPLQLDDQVTQQGAPVGVPSSVVDEFACSVAEPADRLWQNDSPPMLCIMGPTFHDCKTTVQSDTAGRFTQLVRKDRKQWAAATLVVVAPRKNVEARQNLYTGPSGYRLICSWIDSNP